MSNFKYEYERYIIENDLDSKNLFSIHKETYEKFKGRLSQDSQYRNILYAIDTLFCFKKTISIIIVSFAIAMKLARNPVELINEFKIICQLQSPIHDHEVILIKDVIEITMRLVFHLSLKPIRNLTDEDDLKQFVQEIFIILQSSEQKIEKNSKRKPLSLIKKQKNVRYNFETMPNKLPLNSTGTVISKEWCYEVKGEEVTEYISDNSNPMGYKSVTTKTEYISQREVESITKGTARAATHESLNEICIKTINGVVVDCNENKEEYINLEDSQDDVCVKLNPNASFVKSIDVELPT